MFWSWTVVIDAKLCDDTKNHRIAHFKRVNFVVCGLCFNKAVIFKKWQLSWMKGFYPVVQDDFRGPENTLEDI